MYIYTYYYTHVNIPKQTLDKQERTPRPTSYRLKRTRSDIKQTREGI